MISIVACGSPAINRGQRLVAGSHQSVELRAAQPCQQHGETWSGA
jgi:hypothetical protein